jgi:hypothetical protein
LRLTQPLLPAPAGRDLRRKLIAACLAVELILGPLGRDRLLDDLPCDPLVIKRRVAAGVDVDLVTTLAAIRCGPLTDWGTLGMILEVLA